MSRSKRRGGKLTRQIGELEAEAQRRDANGATPKIGVVDAIALAQASMPLREETSGRRLAWARPESQTRGGGADKSLDRVSPSPHYSHAPNQAAYMALDLDITHASFRGSTLNSPRFHNSNSETIHSFPTTDIDPFGFAEMTPFPEPPRMTITQPSGAPMSITGNIIASPTDTRSVEAFPPLSPSAEADLQIAPEEKRMKVAFDSAIVQNMNLPEGHDRVGVLIIKWADDLDQLKCRDEVDRLQDVLKTSFHFETEILELQNSKKPQNQLYSGISCFVEKYDDPQNLLIVYYSGHGSYIDDMFEIHATTQQWERRPKTYEPRACWNAAENPLLGAEAEVLVVFDSCNASNLMKKGGVRDSKTYELLAACSIDGLAVTPGKNSFTEALITCLKSLLEKFEGRSFTTWHLQQQMTRQRPKHPPILWDRRGRDENLIRLAPVKASAPERSESWRHHDPRTRYMNLTFELGTDQLDDDQIEDLAKHLPVAVKKSNVVCHRIEFNSFRARQDHWRSVMEKVMRRNSLRRLSHGSQGSRTSSGANDNAIANATTKAEPAEAATVSGQTPKGPCQAEAFTQEPAAMNSADAVDLERRKRSTSSRDSGHHLEPEPAAKHSRSRARSD